MVIGYYISDKMMPINGSAPHDFIWLGYRRTKHGGDNFETLDGTKYNYRKWANNQPDDAHGLCTIDYVFKIAI
jgi:hypothetical protein